MEFKMAGNSSIEGLAPGPDGTLLRFMYDSAKNEYASVAEGRAIFDTVLYVDVIAPGQMASTPRFELERVWSPQSLAALGLVEPSQKTHKYVEFQEQIEKFKRLEGDQDLGGTPLKMWPRIDRGLASTLAAINIHSVEALAAIPDSSLDRIGMGAMELREQARSFLNVALDSKDTSALTGQVSELTTENKRLRDALDVANVQVRDLQKQIGKLSEKSRLADPLGSFKP
jgi:hypothetical protein